jgi:hypothetical protein
MNANRSWRVIATEVIIENDPIRLLKLIEELNRAMAEQGIETTSRLQTSSMPDAA